MLTFFICNIERHFILYFFFFRNILDGRNHISTVTCYKEFHLYFFLK